MTKSKYIFEQLAREGECRHEFKTVFTSPPPLGHIEGYQCKYCKTFVYRIPEPPDFSKPEGMHWILVRCPEKNVRVEIDVHPIGSAIVISSAITDFSKPRKSMTFNSPNELCARFFDLVYDFLKGGRT